MKSRMIKFNITRCDLIPLEKERFLRSWILVEDDKKQCGWTTACKDLKCRLCKASLGDEVSDVLELGRSHKIIGIIERIKR